MKIADFTVMNNGTLRYHRQRIPACELEAHLVR